MRSHWTRVGTNPMTAALIRRWKFGHIPDPHRVDPHGKTEVEVGEICLQARNAKDYWQPPGAGREACK